MKFSHWLLATLIFVTACSDTSENSEAVHDAAANSTNDPSNLAEGTDPYDELRENVVAWISGQKTFQEALPHWLADADPVRLIGPIHLVGSQGLSSFFIPTPDGHILIDASLQQHGPVILDQIRALGYDPADLKILLNTHAHWDHFGGLAYIKEATEAKMVASAADRPLLESGADRSQIDEIFSAPAVEVDQVIEDGEVIELGGVQLRADILPGHSPGCTSWSLQAEEAGETYDVLIFCSITVSPLGLPDDQEMLDVLVSNYRGSFEKAKPWRPDIFLSNHSEFYNLDSKLAKLKGGNPLAFVEPDEFPAFLTKMENHFNDSLESHRAQNNDVPAGGK